MDRQLTNATEQTAAAAASGAPAAAHAELDDSRQPDGPPRADSPLRRVRHYASMFVDPLGTVATRFARYGDIYRVRLSEGALYVIKHPDHIREVLVDRGSDFGKGHSAFVRLRDVLGDGLLTSEGERWRRQRRLLQPAFTRPRIAEYSAVMAQEAEHTLSALRDGGPQRVWQLSEVMTSLTLRIVARTLFGQPIDDSPRVGRAMLWLNSAFGRPDLLPRSIPTPGRLRARRALCDLDDAVFEVIDHRQRALEAGAPPPQDLLQRLLDARDDEGDGQGLSRREVRDQLLTLYLAGHETTSHALSWTFYLLSRDACARDRLRAELRGVLGGRRPTFDDLASLPYTEWVLKEAMRLYPPVAALPRRALCDTRIGRYSVPAGSEVIIWIYHAHHDPRFYHDPEAYLPERFEETLAAQRPRHAYLPFGAGQRACIGQLFAMIEARLIIATLGQALDFEYADPRPPGLRLGVTLAAKNRLPMRVRPL